MKNVKNLKDGTAVNYHYTFSDRIGAENLTVNITEAMEQKYWERSISAGSYNIFRLGLFVWLNGIACLL